MYKTSQNEIEDKLLLKKYLIKIRIYFIYIGI